MSHEIAFVFNYIRTFCRTFSSVNPIPKKWGYFARIKNSWNRPLFDNKRAQDVIHVDELVQTPKNSEELFLTLVFPFLIFSLWSKRGADKITKSQFSRDFSGCGTVAFWGAHNMRNRHAFYFYFFFAKRPAKKKWTLWSLQNSMHFWGFALFSNEFLEIISQVGKITRVVTKNQEAEAIFFSILQVTNFVGLKFDAKKRDIRHQLRKHFISKNRPLLTVFPQGREILTSCFLHIKIVPKSRDSCWIFHEYKKSVDSIYILPAFSFNSHRN